MNEKKASALASHLEEVANSLSLVDTTPEEGSVIGLVASVEETIQYLFTAMFPYHFGSARQRFEENEKRTWELMRAYDSLMRCLYSVYEDEDKASTTAMKLIDSLPDILAVLKTDVRAGYEGDPAAKSVDEIILTYPAFKAITIYRMAHELYKMQVPLVPRLMTEYAHRITGIDIHPGASIGRYFFIDHGTGVVIGETTTIGDHVKLYQHVTLGAKSFQVGEDGTLVKGIKRHPDIGNRVVIYAGATILGGDTVIGDDCVVGGNVWLTHSLPAGETITTGRQRENKEK